MKQKEKHRGFYFNHLVRCSAHVGDWSFLGLFVPNRGKSVQTKLFTNSYQIYRRCLVLLRLFHPNILHICSLPHIDICYRVQRCVRIHAACRDLYGAYLRHVLTRCREQTNKQKQANNEYAWVNDGLPVNLIDLLPWYTIICPPNFTVHFFLISMIWIYFLLCCFFGRSKFYWLICVIFFVYFGKMKVCKIQSISKYLPFFR